MTRTLITADLHLSDNVRDEYRLRFLDQLPTLIKAEDADEVYLLGDLTEAKDHHSAVLVNQIVDKINTIAETVDRLTILRGNHDGSTPEWPFFRFLRELPNVRYVHDIKRVGPNLFLPHTHNHERDWKGLDFSNVTWIFAHNTFAGAIGEHGAKLQGIPTTVLPKDRVVVSGDVHVPQQLDQVVYVGAPYHIKFGDNFEPRVLVTDFARPIESVPVDTPKKLVIEVGPDLKKLDKVHAQPGDIIKVKVDLTMETYADFAKLEDKVRQWAEQRKLVLVSVHPFVMYDQVRMANKRLPKSDTELLSAYGQARGVDEKTMTVGHKLMDKA